MALLFENLAFVVVIAACAYAVKIAYLLLFDISIVVIGYLLFDGEYIGYVVAQMSVYWFSTYASCWALSSVLGISSAVCLIFSALGVSIKKLGGNSISTSWPIAMSIVLISHLYADRLGCTAIIHSFDHPLNPVLSYHLHRKFICDRAFTAQLYFLLASILTFGISIVLNRAMLYKTDKVVINGIMDRIYTVFSRSEIYKFLLMFFSVGIYVRVLVLYILSCISKQVGSIYGDISVFILGLPGSLVWFLIGIEDSTSLSYYLRYYSRTVEYSYLLFCGIANIWFGLFVYKQIVKRCNKTDRCNTNKQTVPGVRRDKPAWRRG